MTEAEFKNPDLSDMKVCLEQHKKISEAIQRIEICLPRLIESDKQAVLMLMEDDRFLMQNIIRKSKEIK